MLGDNVREENRGLRIVSIGGGTGLSSLLSGLKAHVGEDHLAFEPEAIWIETLTAVVTVTDDGGSSGRLREEFQILPPGDIRNCMVALAEDERLLTQLFQYRFEYPGRAQLNIHIGCIGQEPQKQRTPFLGRKLI